MRLFITTYGVSRDSMRMVSDVILGNKKGNAICPVPIKVKEISKHIC